MAKAKKRGPGRPPGSGKKARGRPVSKKAGRGRPKGKKSGGTKARTPRKAKMVSALAAVLNSQRESVEQAEKLAIQREEIHAEGRELLAQIQELTQRKQNLTAQAAQVENDLRKILGDDVVVPPPGSVASSTAPKPSAEPSTPRKVSKIKQADMILSEATRRSVGKIFTTAELKGLLEAEDFNPGKSHISTMITGAMKHSDAFEYVARAQYKRVTVPEDAVPTESSGGPSLEDMGDASLEDFDDANHLETDEDNEDLDLGGIADAVGKNETD